MITGGCGGPDRYEKERQEQEAALNKESELSVARIDREAIEQQKLADSVGLGRICRATISTVMRRPVTTIGLVNISEDKVIVRYKRKSDGAIYRFSCQVVGRRVFWWNLDGSHNPQAIASRPAIWRMDGKKIHIEDHDGGELIFQQSLSVM